MKKFLIIGMAIAVTFVFGCSGPAETKVPAPTTGGVAATVGDIAITQDELDRAAKNQLQRLDTQIYQIKKGALDDLIEARLIEQAAKKEGSSVEKYLAQEVDAKVTSLADSELQSFYDSNKERFGKQPFDQAKGQIRDYLTQGRKSRARNELIAKLKEGVDIKVNLEPPRVEINIKDAPSIGDKDAKIKLVEFSDYQCPYCKRVRPAIWRLLDEYKGNILYVFRDFPLTFHRDAKKAHEAAHCAGDQGKYFDYNRKAFDNQSNIGVEDLKKYAKELNLDTKKFEKCLASDKYAKRVEESVQAGAGVGVSGTPAFFINGIMLSGAMPYEAFKEIIEQEMKK